MSWATGLVQDGRIDPAEWRRAWEGGDPVGLCDDDGGLVLVAGDRGPVETVHGVEWFTSRCTSCGREQTAPDGRLAVRRRRGQPMPDAVRRALVRA